ncbi:hypothetical protein [Rhizobium sp. A37_96]
MVRLVRLLVALSCLGMLGALLRFATLPPQLVVQGRVLADRVDISPRVSGLILKMNAGVGDTVKREDVIAGLRSPQFAAVIHSTEAALTVASADLTRVNSTRPETIAVPRAEVDVGQPGARLSEVLTLITLAAAHLVFAIVLNTSSSRYRRT